MIICDCQSRAEPPSQIAALSLVFFLPAGQVAVIATGVACVDRQHTSREGLRCLFVMVRAAFFMVPYVLPSRPGSVAGVKARPELNSPSPRTFKLAAIGIGRRDQAPSRPGRLASYR
jgi:hypothetical protein